MQDFTETPRAVRFMRMLLFAAFIIVGCIWGAGIAKEHAANMILLGTEVQTTDEYEQIFNDSFEGNIIEKHKWMYTVRDANGTERTVDKHWLERVGGE